MAYRVWTIDELKKLDKEKVHDLDLEMDPVLGIEIGRYQVSPGDAMFRFYEVVYECGVCEGEGKVKLGKVLDYFLDGEIVMGDDVTDEDIEEISELVIRCPACDGGKVIVYE